jgi:hypothetical protein
MVGYVLHGFMLLLLWIRIFFMRLWWYSERFVVITRQLQAANPLQYLLTLRNTNSIVLLQNGCTCPFFAATLKTLHRTDSKFDTL